MKTVILGKTPYRVLKRRPHYMDLQPIDTEYPHSLLLRDPTRATARWGHAFKGNRSVTWYQQVSDDLFEKIGK